MKIPLKIQIEQELLMLFDQIINNNSIYLSPVSPTISLFLLELEKSADALQDYGVLVGKVTAFLSSSTNTCKWRLILTTRCAHFCIFLSLLFRSTVIRSWSRRTAHKKGSATQRFCSGVWSTAVVDMSQYIQLHCIDISMTLSVTVFFWQRW